MRGLNLLASLARQTPDISLWSWATVTDDSPLRVQLDGESAPLDITPDTLISGLSAGDRVWVQLVTNAHPTRRYRRLVVHGLGGGPEIGLCEEAVQNTSGTTTSTGYTSTLTGGTTCSIVFNAPRSGKVLVHNNVVLSSSGADDANCSILVREGDTIGAGTILLVPSNAFAVRNNGTVPMRAGVAKLVTGLTPGLQYIVYQTFRVAAGTGTFSDKNLILEGK